MLLAALGAGVTAGDCWGASKNLAQDRFPTWDMRSQVRLIVIRRLWRARLDVSCCGP